MTEKDLYDDFFEKQKKGNATVEDIPIVKKMKKGEKLTEKDLIGYMLMLHMGILE